VGESPLGLIGEVVSSSPCCSPSSMPTPSFSTLGVLVCIVFCNICLLNVITCMFVGALLHAAYTDGELLDRESLYTANVSFSMDSQEPCVYSQNKSISETELSFEVVRAFSLSLPVSSSQQLFAYVGKCLDHKLPHARNPASQLYFWLC